MRIADRGPLLLEPSPALSILANGPSWFAGRKVGAIVTDGSSAASWKAVRAAIEDEQANVEVIAPSVGGATLDDGSFLTAQQMVGGAPSVLYDAIVVLASDAGAQVLSALPASKAFIADAHARHKFVGFSPASAMLFAAAGLPADLDDGYVDVSAPAGAEAFVTACRALRLWTRS